MSSSEIPDRPRLVVVRPDRVGDVIISSSCLTSIQEHWPGMELAWMIRSAMAPLFQNHARVQKLIILPDPAKVSWWKRFSHLKGALQEFRADGIVFLHPDSAAQAAAWAAKIPLRLGYVSRGWTWTLSRALPYCKSEGRKHEAEYNFDLLHGTGLSCPEKLRGDVTLPGESLISLEKKIPWPLQKEAFVVLNPSAFSPVARWPVDHFVALAEKLLKQENLRLVLTGDSEEDPSAKEIAGKLSQPGDRVLNLAGRTNLGELGWLLKHAEALVTRDTGPSHLAAAVGCPVVVIFGRTDPLYGPLRWQPLGERVEILQHSLSRSAGEKREVFWQRCFSAITPDAVMERLDRVRIARG